MEHRPLVDLQTLAHLSPAEPRRPMTRAERIDVATLRRLNGHCLETESCDVEVAIEAREPCGIRRK